MNAIPLTGLSGTNPIGAMAAFGLLRVLSLDDSLEPSKLSWRFTDDWRPTIHTAGIENLDALLDHLVQSQAGRAEAAFLDWSTDVKVQPAEYVAVLESAIDELGQSPACLVPGSRERCDFLAAFGSEIVTARSTGDVKPTAFHMTAGQQRLLRSARELAESLDPGLRRTKRQSEDERIAECRDAFREALVGPWRYRDGYHSLGWDPTTEGLYALADISPSAAGATSVRAAVWLAFESLPLFPTVPVTTRSSEPRLVTTGFDLRGEHFMWPLWTTPLRIDSMRSLLSSSITTNAENEERGLRARGIEAVYRSRCLRDGNGRGTFRNAIRVG